MEHSLSAYLERQETEKLDKFLQDCLSGEISGDYAYIIPVIRAILTQRTQQEAGSKDNYKQ